MGNAMSIAVAENFAYVASRNSGLHIVDVANPAAPQVVGFVDTPGEARGVTVSGVHAYIADYTSGLQIVPTHCESPATAVEDGFAGAARIPLQAYPNPGSFQTYLRFETKLSSQVQADVYDVAGRRIRRLSNEYLTAGGHDLLWDGRDDEGRQTSAGIYLVRVSSSEGTATARVVLLR